MSKHRKGKPLRRAQMISLVFLQDGQETNRTTAEIRPDTWDIEVRVDVTERKNDIILTGEIFGDPE